MAQRMVFCSVSAAVRYLGDALQTAFWLLKKPLGGVIFVMALAILCNYVAGKISGMLSPLCFIPAISSTMFCVGRTSFSPIMDKAPQSGDLVKLIELHGDFGNLLDTNVDTAKIRTKLRQSEVATHDLVAHVRASDLRSHDILAEALMHFVEDAKRTGDGLYRLSTRISGAVDRITVVNNNAMNTLSAVTVNDSPPSWITTAFSSRSGTQEAVIIRSYADVMETLAQETEQALLEASASVANLERLQERLYKIQEICVREGLSQSDAHSKLLSEIWSILGGNRDALRKTKERLSLLADVDHYRKQAINHVVWTRDVLLEVAADVEELRDRAAAPQIVGERVPALLLIQSIGRSIERLKEGRQRAGDKLLVSSNDHYGGHRD
ncbi:uncharacterized protein B0H18DRAFT_955998 [Fomitopsis serialis]|uniref:uncharacterized protein n=1 Tax=Fomitopsis serialis TaxID=139415 RepID=UPI002008DC0D|nr:uncharacterized protein B0H18DRAFT_955998 [Neoantrodia serialis]KAH9923075.1 hypothetical protein B0H18DRAFT_955998 [Neoantrodia serialis]